MIGRVKDVLHGLKPILMMIMVQIMLAGVNVVYKLAAADEFSLSVLVTYRFMFSVACIIPYALFAERNKRPKLTWTILFQAFLGGALGGSMAQNLFAKCLELTSATFAAAATNLIPLVTFILALIFRLEKLGWRTSAGKAKLLGTLLSISGAMLLVFYKGPEIDLWKSQIDLLTKVRHHRQSQHATMAPQNSSNMILGTILGLCFIFCYSSWFIVQTKMSESYPCPYSCTALMSTMALFQALVYALCTERDWSQWKLGWNLRLLIVAYAGIFAHAVTFALIAWCIQMRGPLFVSSFNPLLLVLVAIAGFVMLEEKLHLGSVLGAIVIVCGLYVVLWGKGQEMKKVLQLVPEGMEIPEKKDVSESKQLEIDISSLSINNVATSDHVNGISICDDEVNERDLCVDVEKN